ncbi:retrovirus-related pol polyprotein from transposon TNT 1-94 [Tanacetum coccineum]
MAKDGKLKIDSMMVMISVSVRRRSKTLYIRTSFRSLWQKPNLQISFFVEDIRRKTSKEYTNYLLSAEHIYRAEGRISRVEIATRMATFQNQCSKLVAARDKVVNMAARDSNDALVCCVENTVVDRIMDYGASFHATYCKEELERFKLCSGKVRLADDKTLDITCVGDVVLKTSFGTNWTLKDVSCVITKTMVNVAIGNEHLLPKAKRFRCTNIDMDSFFHNVKEDKKLQSRVVESTGIRAEAPKMLWADSVSTTYLIYGIPYVPIGLRIPEEEWRGKDTSRTLEVAQMKCDTAFGIRRVTRLSEAEILHLLTQFMEPVQITQSQGGSLDTSEGSENSGSFEDSGRSDEEYSEDGASYNKGGSETPHVRISTRESRAPIRISAGKKASQRLWMFKVKEEHDGSKRYKARLVVKGFQQKRGVDYNEIFSPVVKMTPIRQLLKVDDLLVAGSDMAEFNKPKWQLPLVFEMKDSALRTECLNKSLCRDVHQREVIPSLMMLVQDTLYRNLPSPVLVGAACFYVRRYRKVGAVALLKGRWFEVYRDYFRRRGVKLSASK